MSALSAASNLILTVIRSLVMMGFSFWG